MIRFRHSTQTLAETRLRRKLGVGEPQINEDEQRSQRMREECAGDVLSLLSLIIGVHLRLPLESGRTAGNGCLLSEVHTGVTRRHPVLACGATAHVSLPVGQLMSFADMSFRMNCGNPEQVDGNVLIQPGSFCVEVQIG